MTISIEEDLRLEGIEQKHAIPLFRAIDENRQHLSVFLPWVPNMGSVEIMQNYIRNCEKLEAQKMEKSFVIYHLKQVVGRIGIHHIDIQNHSAAIGYWLVKAAEGKGIIYKCCKRLLPYGFQELNLHRIEIKCATGNQRSRAIPLKLGFQQEGVLRDAEYVNGKYLDLFVFSLLESDWQENNVIY